MSKEINVEEAKKWSNEEAEANLSYLRQREMNKEVARIEELRGVESAPSDDGIDVSDMNVDEVLDWVGDDLDRARQALDAENMDKGRTTLVEALEAKLA